VSKLLKLEIPAFLKELNAILDFAAVLVYKKAQIT
jgi:hypothetical protein